MKVTPSFVVSFETKLNGIITTNWDRVVSALQWDRIMKVRPSATKKEHLIWMMETARIYGEGDGGNTRFDDMAAASTELENENAGAALELSRNEIEDNQMKDNPSVGALDYATSWAKQIGAAVAYRPQEMAVKLIKGGTTLFGYDGVPFFSASHPLRPTGGGGVYANIIENVPIDATNAASLDTARENFAKALAAVSGQRMINGVPRMLVPKVVVVPTALTYRANLLTGGKIINATDNTILETIYGFETPMTLAELDEEPNVYYLGVSDMLSDELAPFNYSERSAYELRGYTGMNEAELNRRDEFEWHMKGRDGSFYGHPYLFYRCEPN